MRNSLGILGLSIFSYGFATESFAAPEGLFQLLTTLGLLHQLGKEDGSQHDHLRARPGYVLVKAQDILKHATA